MLYKDVPPHNNQPYFTLDAVEYPMFKALYIMSLLLSNSNYFHTGIERTKTYNRDPQTAEIFQKCHDI